ncbi:hypothetical protein BCU83_18010 [Vibrio breoganii]|nr:hypothetical protein BCU83_18010 [Vibrio breoganii]PMM49065.1 hypothetical protein BCT52_03945 [Vibrio breoganii]
MAIGLIPAILIYVSGLRVFTYITLAALVVCLMMTFSRSGMLIALLAISFPFFKKIKLSHLIIILIAISIATSIFLMTNQISSLVPNEDNVFSSRVIGVFSGEDESALGRLSVYFEIISDYQNIFGYGADYAQIISHPTESFVLNALMSIGIISLPCIGVFVFINVYFSKFSSQTSQISQIPILLVVIWFLDDPFLSLTVSLSLVTYQRLLLINEN